MAMNKQRRTSNINNIVTYDTIGNVTLPADLTIEGLTTAGFVKSDANGLLSVDTAAYVTLGSALTGYVIGADSAISASDTILQAFGKIQGQLDAIPNTGFITGTLSTGQVAYGSGAGTIAGSNNLFWDNTNGRLGIGLNTPSTTLFVSGIIGTSNRVRISAGRQFDLIGASTYLDLFDGSAGQSIIRFFASRNVAIGSTTDSGQRLQVNGDTLLKGSDNTSATTALTVQNSDGTNVLRVRNDGLFRFGNTGSSFTINPTSGPTYAIDLAGSNVNFTSGTTTQDCSLGRFLFNGSVLSRTADNVVSVNIASVSTFAPTSGQITGNGRFVELLLQSTINQTGTAVGITRGLHINPTLTSAPDWRSIEWSNNSGWGLYGAGTANNYLAGVFQIGGSPSTSTITNFIIGKTFTNTTHSGALINAQINNTVTSAFGYRSRLFTQGTGFTLPSISHFSAEVSNPSGTDVITISNGFHVTGEFIGATNNFGFRGEIAAGTGRWNLYMNGTADNYLGGRLGIGSTSLGDIIFRVSSTLSGSTGPIAVFADGIISSTSTNVAGYFFTTARTQAATFTLNDLRHYTANSATFGAGSSVTNQYGYTVLSTLTGATNNYGFYGDIPSGTGRWNLYMNGTANNYMAGRLGLGNTDLTAQNLYVRSNITGGVIAFNIYGRSVIQSDVTSSAYMYYSFASTAAASFTLGSLHHFSAFQSGLGAGSSISNQYGFYAHSALVGATNNYGFFGDIPSGTGRWNLYMNGTAANYLNGNTIIGGSAVDGGQKLQVNGTTQITPAADSSALTSTGYSVTGSGTTSMINLTGTWNTTGSPTAIFLNITDTASNANSLLLDLRVGNTSQFSISKVGNIVTNGTFSGRTISLTGGYNSSSNIISVARGSTTTSGTTNAISNSTSFSPTSGTAIYNGFIYEATINQTGGANGITRGLYINPTLTSAADWRSVETSNNTGWAAYFAGTAQSYFGGDVEIGTTTGVRKLNVFSSTADTHVAILGTAPSVSLSDLATGATYQAKFGLATSANQFATGSSAGDFVISNQNGNTIWAYNGTEGMRFTVNRNLLLGGTSDSGKKLQVTGEVNVTSGNATSIELSNTAGNYFLLMSSVSVAPAYGMYISSNDLLFTKTGLATPSITLKSTSGDVVFGNTIKTAAPTTGTAQPWKLGQYNATAPSATGYVEVEVNGTFYKLLAST